MKKVLITGVYGNLGRAVASRFLTGGYRVAGTVAPGEKTDPAIVDPQFESAVVDLTDAVAAADTIGRLGAAGLDAAICTVGGFAMGTLGASSPEEVHRMVRLNFDTAFNSVKPVLSKMMEKGRGRIFLVGARPALEAKLSKGMFAYGLSKLMVVRLAEMINVEAKGSEVTATVIIPSTIDTPQNRASMPEADPRNWVRPEEIAEMIFFQCSENAGAVREAVIKMYGNA